jgi:predicted transcriptional regulator
MHFTTLLEQFGFSEKEAKVYLACLELGQAPVSSIARNIGEQRVTTYTTIKKLIARGIVQSFVKGNATFYSVIAPENLYHRQEEKLKNFKDTLPELVALGTKYDNQPKVQLYEGLEGLKYVIEQVVITDQLKGNFEPILAFLGTKGIDSRFQTYLMQEYVSWRLQYTVPTKVIIPKQSLS